MFKKNSSDDCDEYNECESARYDDYVREEEEYRSEDIVDTNVPSSDSEYINYTSKRSDDDVLWTETVSDRRKSSDAGCAIGCMMWGMFLFPFGVVALAGAVNLWDGNTIIGWLMLIFDAICLVIALIYVFSLSRPKKETYTLTRTHVILKKDKTVTNVPLERITNVYEQINSDGTGNISFRERTDNLIPIEARDGDNKYIHNYHRMKNVPSHDKVCKILKNAIRERRGTRGT